MLITERLRKAVGREYIREMLFDWYFSEYDPDVPPSGCRERLPYNAVRA